MPSVQARGFCLLALCVWLGTPCRSLVQLLAWRKRIAFSASRWQSQVFVFVLELAFLHEGVPPSFANTLFMCRGKCLASRVAAFARWRAMRHATSLAGPPRFAFHLVSVARAAYEEVVWSIWLRFAHAGLAQRSRVSRRFVVALLGRACAQSRLAGNNARRQRGSSKT